MNKAREITEFCLLKGGRPFQTWPASILFSYVLFQVVDRSCYVVRAHGQVRAVMFLWSESEATIRARDSAGEPAFYWQPSRASDALFLAEVIADQNTLPQLYKQAARRWPSWEEKPIFTKRSQGNCSRLVQIPHAVVQRMIFGKEASYGRR